MTARPYQAGMDCTSAPPFCVGRSDFLELGIYEFDIQLASDFEIREARFSLNWPAGWSLIEWSNCSSAVISGDVTRRGDGIHMTFADCLFVGETVLRVVLDYTSPGRFAMEEHPTEGRAAVLSCEWPPKEQWYEEINWWPHVEIGDYCGRAPEAPCSVCEVGGLIGYFAPNETQFDLNMGQSFVDTILVRAPDQCDGIPECDGGWSTYCYSGTRATAEWISLRELGDLGDWYEHWVERTIRTEGLVPGAYSTRITIPGHSDGCCGDSNCEEIALTVHDADQVEHTSWGRLKWRAADSRWIARADSLGHPSQPPTRRP